MAPNAHDSNMDVAHTPLAHCGAGFSAGGPEAVTSIGNRPSKVGQARGLRRTLQCAGGDLQFPRFQSLAKWVSGQRTGVDLQRPLRTGGFACPSAQVKRGMGVSRYSESFPTPRTRAQTSGIRAGDQIMLCEKAGNHLFFY